MQFFLALRHLARKVHQMPINPDAVGMTGEPTERSWSSKDCLLYALGVGAGTIDPTGFELEFTTENSNGVTQRVLPTFPVLTSGDAPWQKLGTYDPAMLVHGEQFIELHGPIPAEGTVTSVTTITGVYDKGTAAVVVTESVARDASSGKAMWTTRNGIFIRGEGGWGGERGPSSKVEFPDRHPDQVVTYATRPDQALLYRLCGDRNPLHSDPTFAALGGFPKPILHGLCTYGFTGRALMHTLCESDPDRVRSLGARFSKPVFPGEELAVSMWMTGRGTAMFRTSTPSGVVIDGGTFTFHE
jgi:acyl dehydratase